MYRVEKFGRDYGEKPVGIADGSENKAAPNICVHKRADERAKFSLEYGNQSQVLVVVRDQRQLMKQLMDAHKVRIIDGIAYRRCMFRDPDSGEAWDPRNPEASAANASTAAAVDALLDLASEAYDAGGGGRPAVGNMALRPLNAMPIVGPNGMPLVPLAPMVPVGGGGGGGRGRNMANTAAALSRCAAVMGQLSRAKESKDEEYTIPPNYDTVGDFV